MAAETIVYTPENGGTNTMIPWLSAMSQKSGIDTTTLLAMANGGFGGLGGNNGILWLFFLWMMWSQNGRNGNFNDYVASMNGTEGRQYLAEIMNGRFDNINTLAQIINTGVETVKSGIFTLQNSINQVGASVGLTAAQTQNAIALGNANLSQQLCECCCNMRYDLATQTNTLQAQAAQNASAAQLQLAQHDSNVRLQLAQNEASDQLAVCQQTNALQSQAASNTNSILGAIQAQNAMITDQFCQLKERELQSKIDTQGDIITQLRGQISNDKQTEAFNAAFNALTDRLTRIESRQPNTIPVTYPNVTAVNNTPYAGGYGFWGNGFGGSIVF